MLIEKAKIPITLFFPNSEKMRSCCLLCARKKFALFRILKNAVTNAAKDEKLKAAKNYTLYIQQMQNDYVVIPDRLKREAIKRAELQKNKPNEKQYFAR